MLPQTASETSVLIPGCGETLTRDLTSRQHVDRVKGKQF